ncbi:MAG: hypothetical protein RL722_876 [Pseudomonadota bacterium]|jgi:NADPH-dependent 2,4-dienoyl-CoA reductase/sulfur reductase-like enzyme/ferredoxin
MAALPRAVAAAPVRPRFPNFSQLSPLLPVWLWDLLRHASLFAALAMAALLLAEPRLGLTLFWGLAVPALPLVFLFAPGLWRNVCPLASSNQLPRRMGMSMALTRRSLALGLAYPLGMLALIGFIIGRKLMFNQSASATALLIVGAMAAAFIGGVLFKGKSGWCSSICPLLPVQRMLGQTAFVDIANTQCQPCVSCTKNCYDYNPSAATLADLYDEDPAYGRYRRFFAMLFPGLVLGFYLLPDIGRPTLAGPALAPHWIVLAMLACMAASLAVFALLDKLLGDTRNRLPLLAVVLGFSIYYWHAAPLIAESIGRLAGLQLKHFNLLHMAPLGSPAEPLRAAASLANLYAQWQPWSGGLLPASPLALLPGPLAEGWQQVWQPARQVLADTPGAAGPLPITPAVLAVLVARGLIVLLALAWVWRSFRSEKAYRQEIGLQVIDTSALKRQAKARQQAERAAEKAAKAAEKARQKRLRGRPEGAGDTLPQALVDQYDGQEIPAEVITAFRDGTLGFNAEPSLMGKVWGSSAFAFLSASRFAPGLEADSAGPVTQMAQLGAEEIGQALAAPVAPPQLATAAVPASPPAAPRSAAPLRPDQPALLLAPEGSRVPIRIGQTLLDALEGCGAPIHPGCRAGSCGADAVAVHDGSPCLGSLGEDERATLARAGRATDGSVRLACVARLRKAGPVTVEVLPNTRMAPAAKPATAAAASPREKKTFDASIRRVIVVGNGVAGLTAAETVREHHPDCEIHLISRERQPSYQRIGLTRLFGATSDVAKLNLKPDDWYLEQRIHCWLNTRVASIDPAEHTLTLATHEVLTWDRLILATGAGAWVPAIPGFGMPGSFVLRQASDALGLRNYVHRYNARHAIVLGGGLLGVEAAEALAQQGVAVQLLTPSAVLLERQLDREAGELVARQLARRKVQVRTGWSVAEVPRSAINRVSHVQLNGPNGASELVETDLLLVCTGTRPELALARGAGLGTDKGILVDTGMRTTQRDIFACGDVAQPPRAPMWGLWAPAAEQGRVAALNALGEKADYAPREPVAVLKLTGLAVRSVGRLRAELADQREYIHRGAAPAAAGRGGEPLPSYTKLVSERGVEDGVERLVGCIIVGEDLDGDDLLAAAVARTPLRQLGDLLTKRSWERRGDAASSVAAAPTAAARPTPQAAPSKSSPASGRARIEPTLDELPPPVAPTGTGGAATRPTPSTPRRPTAPAPALPEPARPEPARPSPSRPTPATPAPSALPAVASPPPAPTPSSTSTSAAAAASRTRAPAGAPTGAPPTAPGAAAPGRAAATSPRPARPAPGVDDDIDSALADLDESISLERDAQRDALLDAAIQSDLRGQPRGPAGRRFAPPDASRFGTLDQSRFGGLGEADEDDDVPPPPSAGLTPRRRR